MEQADVRALMRKAQLERSSVDRVEHPLAKYSAAGKLSCKLCATAVASSTLWPVHLKSGVHLAVRASLSLSLFLTLPCTCRRRCARRRCPCRAVGVCHV
jgi:hypothetical protein